MAFKTSEYAQRYELVRFQLDNPIVTPNNGQHQVKNGYKFTINDRSSFYDWYNAYFEVQFQLQKLADGSAYPATDRISVINGAHSLINQMTIRSSAKIVYDTSNLHKVVFVRNLLEYSDDFARSVAKNSLWYLNVIDSDTIDANGDPAFKAIHTMVTRAALKDVNVIIPLNRYGFFEELNERMLVPLQLQFEIHLQKDNELIQKLAAVDDGRVVINRFYLWVPKIIPKDSLYSKFTDSFLTNSSWMYRKELYQVSSERTTSGYFQILASIDNVKHVFVYLQRAKTDNADLNPYIFDTFKLNAADNNSYLTTCRLEYGNGVFYPETEYDSESKVRIFNDLMSYAMRKNDFNTGTQLNLSNYNSLYSVIYFDLSYQEEKMTRDPKSLVFRYKISVNSAAAFQVHAIILYDEEVIVDKVGNELVIV